MQVADGFRGCCGGLHRHVLRPANWFGIMHNGGRACARYPSRAVVRVVVCVGVCARLCGVVDVSACAYVQHGGGRVPRIGRGCAIEMPQNIFSDKKAFSEPERLYEEYGEQLHALIERRGQLRDRIAVLEQEIHELEATMSDIRRSLIREKEAAIRGSF